MSKPAMFNRLKKFFPIADAVATLFRPQVEVVLHDLANNEIVYIANPISKRKIGESSGEDGVFDFNSSDGVIGPYRKTYRDGQHLRAVTAVIRDDDGTPMAAMCINYDVSELQRIESQLSSLSFLPGSLEPHAPFFHDNWRQRLERRIEEAEARAGMPILSFATPQRAEILTELDSDGLLDFRNAPSAVAERMGISRAALYKHLKVIRVNSKNK